MTLPIQPPIKPMLAKAVSAVPAPAADGTLYEPKWDGFRSVIFRDGDTVVLGSRGEKELTRYFPELVEAVKANFPDRCVIDGEIVVVVGDRLDWDALSQRIHPAESRVNMLAKETPASFVAFDLVAIGDELLLDHPFSERRERLEDALSGAADPIHLTRTTRDPELATEWFNLFEGAGLDGVVAKPAHLPYAPNERLMLKVKHQRTADVVIAGYRWHKTSTDEKPLLGSLLLGLYDGEALEYVGGSSAFTAVRRAELIDELAPLVLAEAQPHPWLDESSPSMRRPGAENRWSSGKDTSWVPLRPERVIEIAYDQMQSGRLRHTGKFLRWRPDRDASSCTYDQLEVPVNYALSDVLQ